MSTSGTIPNWTQPIPGAIPDPVTGEVNVFDQGVYVIGNKAAEKDAALRDVLMALKDDAAKLDQYNQIAKWTAADWNDPATAAAHNALLTQLGIPLPPSPTTATVVTALGAQFNSLALPPIVATDTGDSYPNPSLVSYLDGHLYVAWELSSSPTTTRLDAVSSESPNWNISADTLASIQQAAKDQSSALASQDESKQVYMQSLQTDMTQLGSIESSIMKIALETLRAFAQGF